MLHPYHTIRTSGGHVLLIRRRVSNNLPYIRGRLHFTVSATVKKISSTTIDKASINHQKPYTDEELREFTSEYYIPSALHPVVPAASASIADFPVGKVGLIVAYWQSIPRSNGWVSFAKRAGRLQCYTEKLMPKAMEGDSLLVRDALVPGTSQSITQGYCRWNERPPPGLIVKEDAGTYKEKRVSLSTHTRSLPMPQGHSRNYYQSPPRTEKCERLYAMKRPRVGA
ncbi:hypothetical protein Tco_0624207 [Tanacetum coccineum]|uniref:Uncharacterized protein n=1 Tax=Tanacetum coccineum TaxID=301880 RepID=A0ABQ4WDC7_9ASTR